MVKFSLRNFSFLAFAVFAIFFCAPLMAQPGGSSTYEYLDLSPSARVTSLGGSMIATVDADPNAAYLNPALYNSEMHRALSFSQSFYFAGMSHGYATYAHHSPKLGATFGGGIKYAAYGQFRGTDASGQFQNNFTAGEYVLQMGGAYTASKLTYGANAKILWSQLESYNSAGAALDLGAVYNDTAVGFTAALVLRNMGFQFKSFVPDKQEALPFDLQLGVSKRLAHLPLRVSLILHHLQTFDIRYDDPNDVGQGPQIFNDTTTTEKKYTADKIFRHMIFNGEFYFGKSVFFRLGYNHLRRAELSVDSRPGLAGFSIGGGIRIKQFYLDYGHASFSQAGGENQLTLRTNLSSFSSKKVIIQQ